MVIYLPIIQSQSQLCDLYQSTTISKLSSFKSWNCTKKGDP